MKFYSPSGFRRSNMTSNNAPIVAADNDDANRDDRINPFEFSVDVDKMAVFDIVKEKVKKFYDVVIDKDIKAREKNEKNSMRQWLKAVGLDENCQKAKDYVVSACSPGNVTIMEYDSQLHPKLSSESVVERIEMESMACVTFDSPGTIIIQGVDELRVGVAMSLIDEAIFELTFDAISQQRTGNRDIFAVAVDVPRRRAEEEIGNETVIGGEYTLMEIDDDDDDVATDGSGTRSKTEEMDLDFNGLDAGDAAAAAAEAQVSAMMRSDNPEVQSMIKTARDKDYTAEEIREVLRRGDGSLPPSAGAFLRSLHTNRNMKKSVASDDRNSRLVEFEKIEAALREKKKQAPALSSSSPAQLKKEASDSNDKQPHKYPMNIHDHRSVNIHDHLLSIHERMKQNEERQTSNRAAFIAGSIQSVNGAFPSPTVAVVTTATVAAAAATAARSDKTSSGAFPTKTVAAVTTTIVTAASTVARNDKTSLGPSDGRSQTNVAALDDFSLPRCIAVDDDNDDSSQESSPTQAPKKRRPRRKKKQESGSDTRSRSPLSNPEASRQPNPQNQEPRRDVSQHRNEPCQSAVTTWQPPKPPGQNVRHEAEAAIVLRPPGGGGAPSLLTTRQLRHVVIDGSNVAMAHSNGKHFSCRGIEIVVRFFQKRGHKEITAFVPQWRRQQDTFGNNPITDQRILEELYTEGFANFTPSRRVPGQPNIVPYDDRFIVKLAYETDGIVVSNDNFRDLYVSNPEWKNLLANRVLPYTFAGDLFMPPEDPLGRNGPHIDTFLSKDLTSLDVRQMPLNRLDHRFQQNAAHTSTSGVVGASNNGRMPSDQDYGHWQDVPRRNQPWTGQQQPPVSNFPFTVQQQNATHRPRMSTNDYRDANQTFQRPRNFTARHPVQNAPSYAQHRPALAVQTSRFNGPPSDARRAVETTRFVPPNVARQLMPDPSQFVGTDPPPGNGARPVPTLRSQAETDDIREKLLEIFPDRGGDIDSMLTGDRYVRDLLRLTTMLLPDADD